MGVRLFVIERSYGVRLVLTTRCRNLAPMASLTQNGKRYNRPLKFLRISYLATVDLVAELGVSQYYFTLPIGECKDGDELLRIELMMSSAQ
ncbi:hypothetical protein M9H77_18122 [Catharanthus roseus]|uniref:Uncharacterized protein n=1 Tax=Catharanthus roseus TaxID=4058 RepID=A0ACC0B6J5_CATRO|nr:hypothetical protein M9H77_18122 [Catharanthus roseus]